MFEKLASVQLYNYMRREYPTPPLKLMPDISSADIVEVDSVELQLIVIIIQHLIHDTCDACD